MADHKVFPLSSFKAAPEGGTEAPGTFEAIVSVFGNVDHVNDRVMPGAFEKSIAEWKASGDPVPVIWSHEWKDPTSHIGRVLDIEERPVGLWVKAVIDLDQPKAAQVYRLLAGRRVREFSFAYDVLDQSPDPNDEGINQLNELGLIEVGPTLKGANPATQLLAVKQQLLSGDEAAGLLDETAVTTAEPEPVEPEAEAEPASEPDAQPTSTGTPERGAKADPMMTTAMIGKMRQAVKLLNDVMSAAEGPKAGGNEDGTTDDGKAVDQASTDEEPEGAKSDAVSDDALRTVDVDDWPNDPFRMPYKEAFRVLMRF